MRICMVTTFYPPYHFGGDAVFVQALARALTSAGHQVEVVHCEDAYRVRNRTRPINIPIDSDESDGIKFIYTRFFSCRISELNSVARFSARSVVHILTLLRDADAKR
jgi:hypothetical protein